MTTIDEKLNLIGFKDFVHLSINKRDGKKRMVFNSFFNENWISIGLVKNNEDWIVEKIDDNGIIQKSLATNEKINVEKLILFFKTFYFSNDISDLL